jgi:hypothetical protein
MTGRPKLRAFTRKVEKNGGADAIFERIADGEPIKQIMADYGVSRGMFYLWKKGDEELELKYKVARELAADAHVENALEILDELEDEGDTVTSAQVGAASARANYRKWLATVQNREQYGDQKGGVEVTLNVGQLHLDALRSSGTMPSLPAGEEGEVVEAEVLVIEEPDGTKHEQTDIESEAG